MVKWEISEEKVAAKTLLPLSTVAYHQDNQNRRGITPLSRHSPDGQIHPTTTPSFAKASNVQPLAPQAPPRPATEERGGRSERCEAHRCTQPAGRTGSPAAHTLQVRGSRALRRGPRPPFPSAELVGFSSLSTRVPAGKAPCRPAPWGGRGGAGRRRPPQSRGAGPMAPRPGRRQPSGRVLQGHRREADSSLSPAAAPRSLRPPALCSPRWPRGRRSHRPSGARPALRRWSGCWRCPWPLAAVGDGEPRQGQAWRRWGP